MSTLLNRKRQRISSNTNSSIANQANSNNSNTTDNNTSPAIALSTSVSTNNSSMNSSNNNNQIYPFYPHSYNETLLNNPHSFNFNSQLSDSNTITPSFNSLNKRSKHDQIINLDSDDENYYDPNNLNDHHHITNPSGNSFEDVLIDDDNDLDSSMTFVSRTSSNSSSSNSSNMSFGNSNNNNFQFLNKFSKYNLFNHTNGGNNSIKFKQNNLNLNFTDLNNNYYNNNNNFNSVRNRTKSLPQLTYSFVNYEPMTQRRLISQKIGDIKTTIIPYGGSKSFSAGSSSSNYTYLSNKNLLPSSSSSHNKRKMSFNDTNEINSSNEIIINNQELTECDDKNGHYIINTNSTFANQRFIINELLGQGTFGKVVKAYDQLNYKTVAIKIIKSIPKYREASKIELRILSMLKKHDPKNLNQCIHLLECFDYRDHICIVTDILKKSLYDFLDDNQFLSFPGSHIQAISKQLIRSVAFLHDLNIIHTDLKPENILLKDDRFIIKRKNSSSIKTKILIDPKIYLIDFGSAIFNDEYHSDLVSTRHYRAPEIILGTGWSFPCDIWSMGCILVELVTGEALFKTHENPQHLAMMQKLLNKDIDIKLVNQCILSHHNHGGGKSSKLNGKLKNSQITSATNVNDISITDCFNKSNGKLIFPLPFTSQKLINEVSNLPSLNKLISSKIDIGYDFDISYSFQDSLNIFGVRKQDEEVYEFWYYLIDLIYKMLNFDPDSRISAMEALDHYWFKLGIYDEGILDENDNF